METATASGNPAGKPANVIQLRGMSKTYFKADGSVLVQALKPIDLDIPRGQYLGIMGASGSGKSTLMNLLGALDRPTQGQYLLDGEDIAMLNDESLSQARGRKIGFVFQSFNLIPELNISENVEVPLFYRGTPRTERRKRAIQMLQRVGLGDRLGHRPSQLSGGQQQRVAVARSLVGEPSILLADEPTGNLDSATGRAILNLFDELHEEGLTVIMVTHDESVASRCDRVIRLSDGLIESDELQPKVESSPSTNR
ncbi:MAG: ABC transporter [Phycisphaerae bacterium]|nr:ABC transporter [Phycisphaerae bacterium]